MCSALLCSSFQYQGTDGNKTTPQFECACADHDGIYNLAPLQRKDGKPRFTAPGSCQWEFSYNPCSSFSLGETGNCFGGDVSICMWTENRASFQVIGNQSTFFCGYDRQFKRPQLEYTSQQFPGWKVIIRLQCNPKLKTIEQAKFEVYDHKDQNNPREFILAHKCACPDGCPEDYGTTKPTFITTGAIVTPAPIKLNKEGKIGLPVGISIAGFIMIIIAVILVIWIYRRRQRDNNPRLIDNEMIMNNIGEAEGRKRDSNLRRDVPLGRVVILWSPATM